MTVVCEKMHSICKSSFRYKGGDNGESIRSLLYFVTIFTHTLSYYAKINVLFCVKRKSV